MKATASVAQEMKKRGFTLVSTGGGCTAYSRPIESQPGWQWTVVATDEGMAPESFDCSVTEFEFDAEGAGIDDGTDWATLREFLAFADKVIEDEKALNAAIEELHGKGNGNE